jgi:hypothetical protein
MSSKYPSILPELQVSFYFRLQTIKDLYFHESLKNTIKELDIRNIDSELSKFVSSKNLTKLAEYSLRGEAVFPIPMILKSNPFLLGYYRLLYGFSQKEFYSKGPFGRFKIMEDKGKLTAQAEPEIEELCSSLIYSAEKLILDIGSISLQTITELQLLTVGPQLRGSLNNKYGQAATQKTFNLIKSLISKYIIHSTQNSFEIKNDSGRKVSIRFSSDPDIEIVEKLSAGERGLISVEIKGGRDYSNIHNRIGEAEKSHQKAKRRGHFEFMTILSVDVDYAILRNESPTTNHFFNLDRLSDNTSTEFLNFQDILTSILGIHL